MRMSQRFLEQRAVRTTDTFALPGREIEPVRDRAALDEKVGDLARGRVEVAQRHDTAGGTELDQLTCAVDGIGHERRADGSRLDQDLGQTLGIAEEHRDVGVSKQRSDVADVAEQHDVLLEVQPVDLISHRAGQRPVAGDREERPLTAMELAYTTRFTPPSRAASKQLSIPRTSRRNT